MQFEDSSTIAALASPPGEGGVAVIRLSGSASPKILEKIFKSSLSFNEWQSHHLYYGKLSSLDGEFLDYGLAVWMKAPHSFTGEEVVEFQIHGGKLIAWKVLNALYHYGARAALPGEFSQRAFLNGKMDLTQAEAIADMIAAQSDQALKLAQDQWAGSLSKPVSKLRGSLLESLVFLEAAIDFPEEDIEILESAKIREILAGAQAQLQEWIKDYELGRILREGLIVTLIGKPNVGKSSLLNWLVKEEAAIVHDAPGTTRDVIEKRINLGGLALRLVDTAGIREANEVVEKEGIHRSKAWLEKSDLVLALFDSSSPLTLDDFDLISLISDKKKLLLITKSDLPSSWPIEDLLKETKCTEYLKISAKTSMGLRELESKIPSIFGLADLEKGNHVLLNQLRHKQALEQSLFSLTQAIQSLDEKSSPEWVAGDVMRAAQFVGEVIGEVTTEHILEDIFNRFCIGK